MFYQMQVLELTCKLALLINTTKPIIIKLGNEYQQNYRGVCIIIRNLNY